MHGKKWPQIWRYHRRNNRTRNFPSESIRRVSTTRVKAIRSIPADINRIYTMQINNIFPIYVTIQLKILPTKKLKKAK